MVKKEDEPSGILNQSKTLEPINAPRIPLIMASAATVFVSPPRFLTAGVARASVKLRPTKARLRFADIPIA
jgi:hypothetical protein